MAIVGGDEPRAGRILRGSLASLEYSLIRLRDSGVRGGRKGIRQAGRTGEAESRQVACKICSCCRDDTAPSRATVCVWRAQVMSYPLIDSRRNYRCVWPPEPNAPTTPAGTVPCWRWRQRSATEI